MSRIVLLTLSISLVLVLAFAERIRYDNYNAYRITPRTNQHVDILARLKLSDSLNFFDPHVVADKPVNILVAPHKQREFVDILKNNEMPFELLEENFQRILDAEQAEMQRVRSGVYDWTTYHTIEETYDWMKSVAANKSNNVELFVAGHSYEGRELLGAKVSFKAGNPGVFIEGGTHAREWISPATVTYILNQLLISQDADVRYLAENYDWYIVPHINPDGYVYTHTSDRMWRKTRSPTSNESCPGVDLNRNWDFHWHGEGNSLKPCDEGYIGEAPFSEIEIKSLSQFLTTLKGTVQLYLSFHSHSQLLLFPYGYTENPVENYDDLRNIGNAAIMALAQRYGTQYKVGSIKNLIGRVNGSSIDWVYGVLDVKLAYGYELRPILCSLDEFILPPDQIIPTGEETMDSIVAMIKEGKKLGYFD